MPAGLRELPLEFLHLCLERRRGNRTTKNAQPDSACAPQMVEPRLEGIPEGRPVGASSCMRRGLRAGRVVQVEDRRLHENIASAEACRVIWITFDLDRPAFSAGDEHARAKAVQWHSAGK